MKVKRKTSDLRIWVSKNFHLAQFCGAGAKPNAIQVQNIFKLANKLEELQKELNLHLEIGQCFVPADVQEKVYFGQVDFELANAEKVFVSWDKPGVDARHTCGWIRL